MPELPLSVLALSGASLLAAAVMVAVFIGALFAGSMFLPGRRVKGPELGGETITYRLNGLALLLLTVLAAGAAQVTGVFSLSSLYRHFFALFVVANLFAFAFSGWLYWRGVRRQGEPPGFWSGYFVGVELNPAWLGVDLKMFSYRPSLIGLGLLNASFAVVQYETYGHLTLGMALYQVLTWGYLLNYFLFEAGMLHTWDIIRERFGWALVWGDYVLVPFFYCIVGWWLVDASGPALSPSAAGAILLLYVFGFWVFRAPTGRSTASSATRQRRSGESPPRPSTGACSCRGSGASAGISTTRAKSASTSRLRSPPVFRPGRPICCRSGWWVCCGTARAATSAAAAPSTANCGGVTRNACAGRCSRSFIEGGGGRVTIPAGLLAALFIAGGTLVGV